MIVSAMLGSACAFAVGLLVWLGYHGFHDNLPCIFIRPLIA